MEYVYTTIDNLKKKYPAFLSFLLIMNQIGINI